MINSIRNIAISALVLFVSGLQAADDNAYTKQNEKLVFGFTTTKGKILSISMDNDGKYIIYRYGKPGKVELEYPENKDEAYQLFTYSWYFRPGGAANYGMDRNWLRFQNGEYLFVVYDEYVAEAEHKSVGIKLINQKTKKTIDIKGDIKTRQGSLIDLRFMDKIKKDSFEPS